MRAYIVRRAQPDELFNVIAELEARGMRDDAEYLIKEFVKYYEEEGELVYTLKEEVPLDNARRMLTRKMQEILNLLEENKEFSISEIARELGRSPSNVYRDLVFLQRCKAVRFERRGKRIFPRLLMEGLIFEL